MKLWNEIFAKFLLDIAKIVFTTLILGRIISPQLVSEQMFVLGIMSVVGLLLYSEYNCKAKGDK